MSGSPEPKFHLVLGGTAILRLSEVADEVVSLSAGDIAVLPRGSEHLLQDSPTSATPNLEAIVPHDLVETSPRLVHGGKGPRTMVLCGAFEIHPSGGDVLDMLPALIVLESRAATASRWLAPVTMLLSDRPDKRRGEAAVFAKVADVFLTDALRHYFVAAEPLTLAVPAAAARNEAIATAIRLLRTDSGAAWTVGQLASRVAMSRTSFAAQFSELVGVSPMSYLSKLRLSQGAAHLATSTKGIAEIANLVGFSNEASFSKAFKRRYGEPPGAFRRRAASEPDWNLATR